MATHGVIPGAEWHGTTVLVVRRGNRVAMGGDGQVTVGGTVVKHGATKVRTLAGGNVLAGFAGSAADALALFMRFEARIEEFSGDLGRAAVELVKEWRTDRALRRLEALLLVADPTTTLLLSGTGDLMTPDDGVAAVGSGAAPAIAAARALIAHSSLPADEIVRNSLAIAADIDLYTNARIHVLTLGEGA